MEITLGKCHYGDFDEAATATAVREDGSGWIAVCDEHRDQAEKDGYVPGEPMEGLVPVTGEGADVPEEEREDEAGDKIVDKEGSGDEETEGGLDDLMDDDEADR